MGNSECGMRKLKIRQGPVVAEMRFKNAPASLFLCFGFYSFTYFPHYDFRILGAFDLIGSGASDQPPEASDQQPETKCQPLFGPEYFVSGITQAG